MAKPYIKAQYPPRTCQECGDQFKPIRVDQVFCTAKRPRCKDLAGNREMARAKALYRAMYWLVRKGLPKEEQGRALSEINRTMRRYRDEDEARGLPAPPPPDDVREDMRKSRYALKLPEEVARLKAGMSHDEATRKRALYAKMGLVKAEPVE